EAAATDSESGLIDGLLRRWRSHPAAPPPSAAQPILAQPIASGPPPQPTTARIHPGARSEEHTSELQSLTNLVCRLLLEKQKQPWTCKPTLQIPRRTAAPRQVALPASQTAVDSPTSSIRTSSTGLTPARLTARLHSTPHP